MKIAVAGLTASGKSYHAKKIAKRFGLGYIGGGDVLLQVAGVRRKDIHFWINENGERLSEKRRVAFTVDKKTDELIQELAKTRENVVFDSWTLPWLYEGSDLFTIYLAVDLEARARIAYGSRRQKPFTLDEIRTKIEKKDVFSIQLFKKLYGIDITDYSFFDLVVDNSQMGPAEASRILKKAVIKRFFQ